jgi:glycosyltransferase involved in cell wall biosynthesis
MDPREQLPVPRPPGRRNAAPEWCLFARGAGCCSQKFECRRDPHVVNVVGPKECNVNCPRAVPALRIGAVITAWNEGDWVKQTVESLAASMRDERAELHVIVVDDGSTDGSCQDTDGWISDPVQAARCQLTVMRNEEPVGVGRGRNMGAAFALEHGCNVVTFHDGHMRFEACDAWAHPWGLIEHLARRALQERAILCAGSLGIKEGSTRYWVCDLFYNSKDGLQPKWRCIGGKQQPKEEWPVSPCMMGAGYVMSAETARALTEPTGAIWEDTAGRWGFSEQALSVKAFLMGVPVRFSRDVWLRHLYRDKNPLDGAGTDKWKNVARSMFVLLGEDLFNERFRAFCENRLGKQALEEILEGLEEYPNPEVDDEALAFEDWQWRDHREDIFTTLCGKRATPGELHPDWNFWTEPSVEQFVSGMIEKKATYVHRILVWRPSECLLWLREELPDADIRCLDFDGPRLKTWASWCKAHKVQLHAVAADRDYYERPQTWGVKFDLVVIAGAVQARCKAVAERLLAPGGRIVLAPSGLRGQVADEHAQGEDVQADKLVKKVGPTPERLKAAKPGPDQTDRSDQTDQPAPAPAPLEGRAPARPVATIALLNWKRPENIPIILDALAAQTVPVQVYLWDNGVEFGAHFDQMDDPVNHPIVALKVVTSQNLGCFPRWQMLAWADTEFVGAIDDDLCPKPELIERAIAACRGKCPDGLVGAFGMNTVEGKSYRNAQHIHRPKKDRWVEIVKGRFMLFRRELLTRIPLAAPAWDEEEPIAFRCDDIFLSLAIGLLPDREGLHREEGHLLPGSLRDQVKELGGQKVALASQHGHYQIRDKAIAHLRGWLSRPLAVSSVPEVFA